MKQNPKKTLLALSILSSALALASCGKNETSQVNAPSPGQDSAASAQILLAEAPAALVSVGKARQEAQPGQEITLIGKVGGTLNPIAESYATFVLADQTVYFCDEMPNDTCETPWDACCEDPAKLAANRASVVFLNEQGQPLPLDLSQTAQLQKLALVSVTGIVAPTSSPENLIVHANGLYHHRLE